MADYTLNATVREVKGKKTAKLREKMILPIVVYGSGVKNESLQVPKNEFEKLYNDAGESSLIDLVIDGKSPVTVLIQEVTYSPVKNEIVHADLFAVDLTKKITASVDLRFVGESLAVKALGGTLVKSLDEVEIECLPQDLIHEIVVDLSVLKTFDEAIHVKDLPLPENVTITFDPDNMVASVAAPREEVIEDKAPEAAMPEVEGEEKAEGEDGAEEKKEAGE